MILHPSRRGGTAHGRPSGLHRRPALAPVTSAPLAPRQGALASDGSWPFDWDDTHRLLIELFDAYGEGRFLRSLAELSRRPDALHTRAFAHAA